MTAEASIRHASPGRLRLHLPGMTTDPLLLNELREVTERHELRVSFRSNPRTATLLVCADEPAVIGDWLTQAEAAGLIRVSDPVASPSERLGTQLREARESADDFLRNISGNRVDLRLLALAGLGGLGIWQLRRGYFLPAGLTLLLDAGALLRSRQPRPAAPAEP